MAKGLCMGRGQRAKARGWRHTARGGGAGRGAAALCGCTLAPTVRCRQPSKHATLHSRLRPPPHRHPTACQHAATGLYYAHRSPVATSPCSSVNISTSADISDSTADAHATISAKAHTTFQVGAIVLVGSRESAVVISGQNANFFFQPERSTTKSLKRAVWKPQCYYTKHDVTALRSASSPLFLPRAPTVKPRRFLCDGLCHVG